MMRDLTPERSRDDEATLIPPTQKTEATGHPLDPAFGILVGVVVGSAAWVLLVFAFWSVVVLARR